MDNISIGFLGEINSFVQKKFDIKETAYIFEMDFEKIISNIPKNKFYKSIPRFPEIERDITVICDKEITVGQLFEYINNIKEKLIEKIKLFDVYIGDPISSDKKSISFRITYRSYEKTLEDTIINNIHKNITEKLIEEFKLSLP